MNCSSARDRISRLTCKEDLTSEPGLASHVEGCSPCAHALQRHARLLSDLASPEPLPPFPDLAPRILARLDEPRVRRGTAWRWAAAAAFAVAALALGYIAGLRSTGTAVPQESMAAAYQEAFATMPQGTELAYLEGAGMQAAAVPASSRP